jgi:hypothetical protein
MPLNAVDIDFLGMFSIVNGPTIYDLKFTFRSGEDSMRCVGFSGAWREIEQSEK